MEETAAALLEATAVFALPQFDWKGAHVYLVSAAPSERATEPIEKKLAKMIRKEVVQSAENAAV